MSRDKCGAAALAGYMKFVELKAPEDVHVIVALCMVRNSVGEECYVADEIITSRAGVRIRIGNTDAEGRMAMADCLSMMRERVVKENLVDPHLYTVATLTGHACLAVGDYTAVMDNKVAENAGHGLSFCKAGDLLGDPAEISPLRREDFAFHRAKVSTIIYIKILRNIKITFNITLRLTVKIYCNATICHRHEHREVIKLQLLS